MDGGSFIKATSATTGYSSVVKLDSTNSAEFPQEIWNFQVVSFLGPKALEGKVYCGQISNVNLSQPSQDVTINISEVNCSNEPLKTFVAEVSNQFGVVVVNNIHIINDQLVITGSGLNKVTGVKTSVNSVEKILTISSVTANEIKVNATSALKYVIGSFGNLILTTVDATSVYPITFDFPPTGAMTGQVLKFNGTTWAPATLASSQNYLGTWDAGTDTPSLSSVASPSNGDYYLVATAGTSNSISYGVGDWVMYNGTNWEKIPYSSNSVTSFNGRNGTVVLDPSDYSRLKNTTAPYKIPGSSIKDFVDVDMTTAPIGGNILTYSAATAKWIPSAPNNNGMGTVTNVSATSPLSVIAGSTAPSISISQASSSTNGYLSSTDWSTFNNKEGQIPAGGSTQYYRGDKTWQALSTSAVTEGTNLYFTNGRVLDVPLSGLNTIATSAITATDTILQGMGKVQGQINAQALTLGTKANLTNITQTITALAVTGLTAPNAGSDATNKAYVDSLALWNKNGTNTYTLSSKIGIGINSPEKNIDIVANDNAGMKILNPSTTVSNGFLGASLIIQNYAGANPNSAPRIEFGNTRGTKGSAQTNLLEVNDSLMEINSKVDNNNSPVLGPQIQLKADNAWIAGALPTNQNASINFNTPTNGTPTTKMVIKSNGNVGIGTLSPTAPLQIATTGTVAAMFTMGTGGTTSCSVTSGGLSCSSDIRLKENIEQISDGLDKVLGLRGVTYQWKKRNANDHIRQTDFIAQELEKVAPDLVAVGPRGYKQVN